MQRALIFIATIILYGILTLVAILLLAVSIVMVCSGSAWKLLSRKRSTAQSQPLTSAIDLKEIT